MAKDKDTSIAWMRGMQFAYKPILLTMAMAIGYYLSARLSLLLQVQPENIAVFWPAAGLSSGALIVLGRSARLPVAIAVMLVTFAANIEHGALPLVAVSFGICNAMECLLMAEIIRWLFGHPFQLNSLKQVFGFVAAALAATAIAALPAALTLVYIAGVPAPVATLWHTWLESDLTGIITLAPLLIAVPMALRERLPAPLLFEGIFLLNAVVFAAIYIFAHLPIEASWPSVIPLGLFLPILLWQAIRFPPIFAATNSFAIALVIVFCMGKGLGALGQPSQPLAVRILAAQGAMLTLTLCVLIFAAMVAGQRSIEAALRTSEQRLRLASMAAGLGVFERNMKEDRTVWENERMYAIFAHGRADGALSRAEFVENYLDPDGRERFAKDYAKGLASGEVHTNCRIRRKDGVWREIEIIGTVERDQDGEPERLVGVMADITDRRRAEQQQALLIGELDHRVKNALQSVASLIVSTSGNATDLTQFVDTLSGRIHSMAQAHQLLSREHWTGVTLGELVAEHLAPYTGPGRFEIDGPDIKISADATQVFSLVLHELATNAAKYGALSTATGRVRVAWTRNADVRGTPCNGQLDVTWTEMGGPEVKFPTRTGFGTKAIRNAISYQLNGKVDIDFAADGLRCRITAPLAQLLAE